MINNKQKAIIKKDVNNVIFNKQIFLTLLILPLVSSVVLPLILIVPIYFTQDDLGDFQGMLNMLPAHQHLDNLVMTVIGLILNYIMPTFFMMIPIIVASTTAASSFVGEKEKRTLETLLYSPVSVREIFRAKVFSSFVISMIVTYISFLVMLVVIKLATYFMMGAIVTPEVNWLITLLLVSPAISLMSIILIVRESAKAQTMEESYQRSSLLVLPIILMVIGQFAGVIFINAWLLLGIGVILAVLAVTLMKNTLKNFTYEMLLR